MKTFYIKFKLIMSRPADCNMPEVYDENRMLVRADDEQDAIAKLDAYVDQEVLCLTTMLGVPVLMDVGPGGATPAIISIQEFVSPGQLVQ